MSALFSEPARSEPASTAGASELPVAEPAVGLSVSDLQCPICVETIQDAFVTTCGHTFCYHCICTHLRNRPSCPSCSHYLTIDLIYPNFLLNKILKKAAATTNASTCSLVDYVEQALAEGGPGLHADDLDAVIRILATRRQQLVEHEANISPHLLLLFLQEARQQQEAQAAALSAELDALQQDLAATQKLYTSLARTLPDEAVPHSTSLALARQQPLSQLLHCDQQQGHILLQASQLGQSGAQGAGLAGGVGQPADPSHTNGEASSGRTPGRGHRRVRSASGLAPLGAESQHGSHEPAGSDAGTATSGLLQPGPQPRVWQQGDGHLTHVGVAGQLGPGAAQQSPPGRVHSGMRKCASHPALCAEADAAPLLTSADRSGRGHASAVGCAPSQQLPAAMPVGAGTLPLPAVGPDMARPTQPAQLLPLPLVGLQQGPGQQVRLPAAAPVDRDRNLKRQRIAACFDELHRRYLHLRSEQPDRTGSPDPAGPGAGTGPWGSLPPGLAKFSEVLTASTRGHRLSAVAELFAGVTRPPGSSGRASSASGGMVSTLELDAHENLLATCSAQRVALWSYSSLLPGGQGGAAPVPLMEVTGRSSFTSLAWSKHTQNLLLVSTSEGHMQLWDTQRQQPVSEVAAHSRRIWTVDMAPGLAVDGGAAAGGSLGTDLFATGSDDYCVKVWSPSSSTPALSMDTHANVCSVRFCPWDPHLLAVGSAAMAVLLFDLRKAGSGQPPLASLAGHRKAVSHVRWASPTELVSASTDSSLKLWRLTASSLAGLSRQAGQTAGIRLAPAAQREDAAAGACMRTYTGHVNERHFVGLAAYGDMLAVGSETGEVCLYAKPTATVSFRHKLASAGPRQQQDHATANAAAPPQHAGFVSSLTWRTSSNTLLAANSTGSVFVLRLRS